MNCPGYNESRYISVTRLDELADYRLVTSSSEVRGLSVASHAKSAFNPLLSSPLHVFLFRFQFGITILIITDHRENFSLGYYYHNKIDCVIVICERENGKKEQRVYITESSIGLISMIV